VANEFDAGKADGLFKTVYADKITDVRPGSAIVQKLLPFSKEAKLGKQYAVDIEMKAPQGWSHTGAATTVTALKGPRNAQHIQATSSSFESVLREQIQYKTLSQATSEGPAAFKKATSAIVMGMQKSAANRLEALLLHGQDATNGLGVVESVADATGSQVDVVITAATWSTGLWYSAIGATVDAITSGATVNNGSGPLIVVKVTPSTRTVRFDHLGTFSNEVAAGDVLHFESCGITATPLALAGLVIQASNTTGTVHGLSAATHPNWAANTYDANGPISFGLLEDALHQVRSRAGDCGKLVCLAGRAYSTLARDLVEAGKLDLGATAKSITNGVKGMSYDAGADLGEFEIVFHPMMMDGHIVIFPKEETCRGGASDITFNLAGEDEKFFQYIAGYNAFELQCLFDQFLMVKKPGASMLISGITYS